MIVIDFTSLCESQCSRRPSHATQLAELMQIELAPEDQTTEVAVDGGRVPLESRELVLLSPEESHDLL